MKYNSKISNSKTAVRKMKFQPELNAENVTVDTYPMALEKEHTYKGGNI